MKKIIFILGMLLLIGCKQEINSDYFIGNGSLIEIKEYTGDLYYCFYSDYENRDVCLPYTEEVRLGIIEVDEITSYKIFNISDKSHCKFKFGDIVMGVGEGVVIEVNPLPFSDYCQYYIQVISTYIREGDALGNETYYPYHLNLNEKRPSYIMGDWTIYKHTKKK